LIDSTPFQISARNEPLILAGGSGGVSLAVQGQLAWFIYEESDAGVVIPSCGGARSDGGVEDAGAAPYDASDGGGPEGGQPAAAEDGGTTDATMSPDTSGGAATPPDSGLEAGGAVSDASVSEDATAPVDSTDSGSIGNDATEPDGGAASSSSGCNVGSGVPSDGAGFFGPLVALRLLVRRRRRSKVPFADVRDRRRAP
jgi:MYXO-CTERM domain-containing protein